MIVFTIGIWVSLNRYGLFGTEDHTPLTIYTVLIFATDDILFMVIVVNSVGALFNTELALVASVIISFNNVLW